MKRNYKELLIVEGKSDINFIKNIADIDCFPVEGYSLSNGDINFIKRANDYRGCILLLDPDSPGYFLRERIKTACPNIKEIFIKKSVSIKKGKVGVAESKPFYVKELVEKYATKECFNHLITRDDLFDLGLISSNESRNRRAKVCELLNIGNSSSKEFLLKINSIGLTYNELKEIIYVK